MSDQTKARSTQQTSTQLLNLYIAKSIVCSAHPAKIILQSYAFTSEVGTTCPLTLYMYVYNVTLFKHECLRKHLLPRANSNH